MAFFKGFKSLAASDLTSENATTSITHLPANILEVFIPGYSVLSRFLHEFLGFDVTLVVSIAFVIFGFITSVQYLWRHAYNAFEDYFTSFISINSDDDIFDHVMDWIITQKVSQNSRALSAKTGTATAWDDDDCAEEDFADDDDVLLNFSNWDSKVPPKFQPFYGRHRFFHRGRMFEFLRDQKQTMYQGWGGSVLQAEETIKLTCIGRSTQPIKDLIRECQDHYFDNESSRTIVRRPATKEVRQRGRNPWTKVATRPSRPMETVVLDHQQKAAILADINEYLHPATPRWYANRGIPYRRGYLFYGPPGTGKTSLSFAIAGVFGLDIYCISLLEPTLTEEDLGLLFNNLPRRCVVLLEDIDHAGLIKRDGPESEGSLEKKEPETQIGAEIAKAFKSVQEKNERGKGSNQGISLSGLLNAIDGVASHEGRVLVMTTNFPEKLDEALIRPGRVDMKVGFTKATQSQIQELFVRMYSSDAPSTALKATGKQALIKATQGNRQEKLVNGEAKKSGGMLTPPSTPRSSIVPTGELKDIADEFAKRLPDSTFTPAEIQGFLLTRKKEPRRALDEVENWREKSLEAKAAKSKLAPSQ